MVRGAVGGGIGLGEHPGLGRGGLLDEDRPGGGVALAIYPLQFLIALAVWAVVLRVSRYMSVASLSAAWAFACISIFTLPDLTHKLIAVACACFITWTHRANIERLRKGQELPFIVNRNK